MTQETAESTRHKLLDAAETLIADRGVSRTSLRAITRRARANIAAVNYHFGSKDGLVAAVFDRRLRPVNEQRLRRLDRLQRGKAGLLTLETVLDAFFRPVFEQQYESLERAQIVQRLVGRLVSEPGAARQRIIEEQFREVGQRFSGALSRLLPALPMPVVIWRLHFAIGAIIQLALHGDAICRQSSGLCDVSRVEEVTAQLVAFSAAGFRAPVPASSGFSAPPDLVGRS